MEIGKRTQWHRSWNPLAGINRIAVLPFAPSMASVLSA
jgi:hypothetical protein